MSLGGSAPLAKFQQMWIELTEALIKERVSAGEFRAILNAAKQPEQTAEGILDSRLLSLARYVRGFCPTGVPRGAGDTIPDKAEDVALAILRNRLFARLPGMAAQFYDEFRKSEYDNAEGWLKAWARGERYVVPPEDVAPAQSAQPKVRVISAPKRQAGRSQTSGL